MKHAIQVIQGQVVEGLTCRTAWVSESTYTLVALTLGDGTLVRITAEIDQLYNEPVLAVKVAPGKKGESTKEKPEC